MRWLWLWIAILAIGLGCTTPTERGDRAMELEDYGAALTHYEQAIADGSQDPQVYFNAARAAQHHGAFGKAERYFSQSLRHGGDADVARELAKFYVQTNNFTQAVKVFQYLLRVDGDEPQPLYSNIGTALMYGGYYMDAESYLLLAQQIDPTDPVPYINLGVLYDRHLGNWPRAVRFYECFVEMSGDSTKTRSVSTRLQEMRNVRNVDTSRVGLTCGDKYRAQAPEMHDLGEVIGFDEGDGEVRQTQEGSSMPGINLDIPLDYDPAADTDESVDEAHSIEIIDSGPGERETSQSEQVGATPAVASQTQQAYDDGRYDAVVESLQEKSPGDLTHDERALLGESLYRTGRFSQAADILEELLTQQPTPERAQWLIDAYRRVDDEEGRRGVCDRFSDWPDYEDALSDC